MLNLLFNTLLTITPHNTQKRRRRKERTTYGPLLVRQYSRMVTHPVRNPTGLKVSVNENFSTMLDFGFFGFLA